VTVNGGAAAIRDVHEQLRRIESVTDLALAKLTLEELLDELLTRMRELLGVDTAAVLLMDDSGAFLTPVAAKGLEDEVRQGVRIPLGAGFAGRVAASRQPVVIPHVDATNVVNPILLRHGVHSVVGVPLLDGAMVIGVLHVGSLRPREFVDDDIAVLQLAASRVANAIHTRRAYMDRAAAASLQRSLAPRQLPDLPNYRFAGRYVPGSQYGVSGDWYDVFTLPDRRLGIVIGDVMGHGVRAATVMGRLKSALRAYALDYDEPARVLHRLDRKIQHFEPGQMATVVYGVLDPQSGRLHVSSAGHLPAVRTGPDHAAALVCGATGLPLGVDVDATRATVDVPLAPGSTLCLFTDGLLDRYSPDIDAGLDAVVTALADPSEHVGVLPTRQGDCQDADSVCAVLMAELVDDRVVRDDVTILALTRTA
jgi:phosphoserine phosphatase RsbU/P